MSRIFPALLMFAPLMAPAAIIEDSTTEAQTFSIDPSYTINENVLISTGSNTAAVTIAGDQLLTVDNEGKLPIPEMLSILIPVRRNLSLTTHNLV